MATLPLFFAKKKLLSISVDNFNVSSKHKANISPLQSHTH